MARTFKTRNNLAPPLGPVGLPETLNFEGVNSVFALDFTEEIDAMAIDIIQSVWVDNADNPNRLVIQFDQTLQRIVIPANSQNFVPVIVPQHPRCMVRCLDNNAFAGKVQLIFMNTPMPIASWGNVSIGNVNAVLTPTISNIADHSGAIVAGGVSQVAIPANAARTRFLIQNPGNSPENIFINFIDPATGNGDSIELFPGGTFDSGFGPIATGAINVVAATLGTKYTAKEWS